MRRGGIDLRLTGGVEHCTYVGSERGDRKNAGRGKVLKKSQVSGEEKGFDQ